MDRERLQQLIESYGADLARWPEEERPEASALLEAEPSLRTLLEEHNELDELLSLDPDASPTAELRRAVAEIPIRHPQATGLKAWWPFGSLWQPAFAGAFVLALGVWAGQQPVTDQTTATAGMDDTEEWDELSALAFAGAAYLDEEEVSE